MPKDISVSNLRKEIKRVLNEVRYGQTEYLVKKFDEPTVAIISIEEYHLLQSLKKQQTTSKEPEYPNPFLTHLNAIHQTLQKSGYQTRTVAEVEAQVRIERDSWSTK